MRDETFDTNEAAFDAIRKKGVQIEALRRVVENGRSILVVRVLPGRRDDSKVIPTYRVRNPKGVQLTKAA